MEQKISFCISPDGVHIAYAIIGQGPVILMPAHWVSHLEVEWENPNYRAFMKKVADKYTIVRYDKHGCGLSDRERTDFSLEKELQDLKLIIDHLKLRRFILFGFSMGGSTSIAYAVKYPQRVSHLILYGAYIRGIISRPSKMVEPLCALIRSSWGVGSKTIANIVMPNGNADGLNFFTRWQRESATGEMAARMIEAAMTEIDVTELLSKIDTPTIILHRNGDQFCSIQRDKELSAAIPNSRLVLLDGIEHIHYSGNSGQAFNTIFNFHGDNVTLVSRN